MWEVILEFEGVLDIWEGGSSEGVGGGFGCGYGVCGGGVYRGGGGGG